MGIDFDPLDDIFADEAVKNARAVGKFQPKSKFRPPRKDLAATSVSSSQAIQTIDSAQSELSEPVGTAKPSEHLISGSDVVPNDNGSWHTFMEKSVGENADIFIGLEALGDFLPHTSSDMECTVPPSEAVALNVPNPENAGGGLAIPVLSSVENSTHTCKVADVPTYPDLSADIDPLTAGEPIVSSSDGREHMHDRELGGEEMGAMDSINMTELTTKSGLRTGKFQPKPKIQMHKEICEASESVSYSLDSQSVPPEINYAEKDSIPAFQQDDVLDLSSLGFTHTLTTETTSELPLNEESMNLMEMARLDSGIHLEDVPEIPVKLVSRRAKTGSSKTHAAPDPSPQQQKASTSSQENETGRSLRPRKSKTNFCELVDEDEDEDEVLASGEFSHECPLSSAIEEENINNEEFQVENESQMKKVKRKSKKTDDDEEKPAKKQKKAKEASDQDARAKLKKFSHSTRRRRVDKVLLETPEDEIDYQKVPLRDLILLAEHKERQMKKEEAAAGAPATKQSNGNSSGLYNEDETSKQGGEYNDGQGSPRVEDSTIYFNYQTYMDRTPSTRWSKQDTELFYEAVRQFGTDLSMIQQLFPGRTRRQVKLKYKKEERQHPLRLREALTNRPKDHSHFEKVIERLQQIAAEENQNADKDDSIDLTGNEVADEGTSNADDEEAKGEHIEEEENEDVANDFIEVQSPLKSDDGEDDLFRWSQYKSDT
ncbi:hypothetical protein Pfo_015532 [Paulownia fortunei]|nr:hypothetical protein Pfo_015532 [Paulownia fortunei]